MRYLVLLCLAFVVVFSQELRCTGDCQRGDDNAKMNKVMTLKKKQWDECMHEGRCPNTELANAGRTPCINGKAGEYECKNVDMESYVNLPTLGSGGDGNDIWGWTDTAHKKEIAIVCTFDGTSFVDVTKPENPCVLGFLPTQTVGSSWRDAKVCQDTVYIVSEARNHGMQVFDLTKLRPLYAICTSIFSSNFTANVAPPTLTVTAHYSQFGNCHNIAINEESRFAYAVGSGTCRAGLHMIDISEPHAPKFAGCYQEDGYVHDTQCVIYNGPDARFTKKEICFCFDEDTLTIVDVQDKLKPVTLSRIAYPMTQYTHQGWLLEDHQHLLLDDELDEMQNRINTRTLVWDVKDLTKPVLVSKATYFAEDPVIDHNLYILGKCAFLSNYCGGLRILDTSGVAAGKAMEEVAFFDVAPDCNTPEFYGAWSSYIYFPSGTIVTNSIERGLFVLKFNDIAGRCGKDV